MNEIVAVTVPKWGLSMEEGLITHWHVSVGARATSGDELVDIETSKIANVVEAPVTGVVRRIVAARGERVLVGQLLAVISSENVPEQDIDDFVARMQADFVPPEPAGDAEPGPRSIEAGGHRTSYLLADPGKGDSLPMLLLHGFGADAGSWLFNMPELARDRQVLAPDLPGHGSSGKDVGDGTVAFLSRRVAGFMDALGVARAHVVGHSLGGAIATWLAIHEPDRVESLALISPAGFCETINREFVDGFIAARNRREMKAVLGMLVHDERLVSREMLESVLRYRRIDGAIAALQVIAGAVFPGGRQAEDFRAALADPGMPWAIIAGTRDRVFDLSRLAGHVPPDRLLQVEGAGHLPHMESPRTVNPFLAALAGGR